MVYVPPRHLRCIYYFLDMKIFILSAFFLCFSVRGQTITQTFGSGDQAFSIEFVTIGNPGNTSAAGGFGSVPYTYNLGKYEVSRDMITKANLIGGLGITMFDMTNQGGNGPNRPATYITWNEAARFVNFLNISHGYQAAYLFTSSGIDANIALWGAGQYLGNNQFRHKDAFYFLPSADEWYKGAFGSPAGNWYKFATGSDQAPIAVSDGTTPGTAVYGQPTETGPADVTNAGGLSPYGTMAQGGNLWEWTESAYDRVNDSANEARQLRGGSWDNLSGLLEDGYVPAFSPESQNVHNGFGFRVAMVPEPTSFWLFLFGGAVLIAGRWRKQD